MPDAKLPTIFFIRHGETDWNAEGRLQGQRDIPLNALGRVQAEEAGKILSSLSSSFVAQVEDLDWWVSPLLRTRETAERAREAIGLHPTYYKMDERLKELSFGLWEGMTWKDVRRADPAGALKREKGKWHMVPPEGESYVMLAERVTAFLAGLTRDTVMVSHGGVGRAMMHLVAGQTKEHAAAQDIWQGKVLLFQNGACRWVG
jgi:broad specificity phosphatase PhoE